MAKRQKNESAWQLTVKVTVPGYKSIFFRGIALATSEKEAGEYVISVFKRDYAEQNINNLVFEITKSQKLWSEFILKANKSEE